LGYVFDRFSIFNIGFANLKNRFIGYHYIQQKKITK